MSLSYVDSQPDTHIKAIVFEVDPKVLSRNAPESIGESKHFTIASSLRGEVTATRKIGPTRHFDSSPHAISPGLSFFFSSRRRHTRCSRDWSSDVCSSD